MNTLSTKSETKKWIGLLIILMALAVAECVKNCETARAII